MNDKLADYKVVCNKNNNVERFQRFYPDGCATIPDDAPKSFAAIKKLRKMKPVKNEIQNTIPNCYDLIRLHHSFGFRPVGQGAIQHNGSYSTINIIFASTINKVDIVHRLTQHKPKVQ